MPVSPVQEIKDRLDVVEVIKGYIPLQPAGRNLKGLCPFHREKTPSFMVSPERQSWHCFGCSAGGDMFAFVMGYENVEFGEALRMLAERAGVELARISPQEYKQFGLLYDINHAAKEFYKECLANTLRARKYLEERGLTQKTIDEFELGFAPDSSDALMVALIKKGYDANDIIRAGLCIRTDRGLRMDRFRGRIMFPIHNHTGKIVGFTGRILPEFEKEGIGKYVNSPETPIFAKSKLLYGFFRSKPFIREKGKTFLVEGQMDFLMSWQAGVKNTVATSGTAFTEDHLRALRRLCDVLIFRFDSDEAGYAALERAIDLAENHDFGVCVALDTVYKDPAEAAQKDAAHLVQTIARAIPAPEFYFHRYLPEASGKADFRNREYLARLRTVLGKLRHIASPVERATWIQTLARKIGISESILLEEIEHVSEPRVHSPTKEEPDILPRKDTRTRWELLSERILACAIMNEENNLVVSCQELLAPRYKKAAVVLASGVKKSDDKEIDEILHTIILASELFSGEDVDTLRVNLEKEAMNEKRKSVIGEIQQAEARGDGVALAAALAELANLPII